MTRAIFLVLLMIAGITNTRAGDSTQVRGKAFSPYQWGGQFGYGFVNEHIPEGEYGPFLLSGLLEFHLHRRTRNPEGAHFFLLYAEPQVLPVLIAGGIREWEAGCNIGAKYRVAIRDKNGLSWHVGSGPHYISLDSPQHQAGGFAFASNFGMAYDREFRRDVSITVGYRFRHVSNLDLQSPNLGLDNHFLTVGFRKDFPRRVQQRRARSSELPAGL